MVSEKLREFVRVCVVFCLVMFVCLSAVVVVCPVGAVADHVVSSYSFAYADSFYRLKVAEYAAGAGVSDVGQTFTVGSGDAYLTGIQVNLYRAGSPSGISISCRLEGCDNTANHVPNGTILKESQYFVNGDTLSTDSSNLVIFPFDGTYLLKNGQSYAWVVYALTVTSADDSNCVKVGNDATGVTGGYASGFTMGSWGSPENLLKNCYYVYGNVDAAVVVPDSVYCDCLLDGDSDSGYWNYPWSSASGMNLSDYQYPYALAVEQGHEYGYSGGFFTSPSNTFCDDDGFYYLEVGDWFDTVAGAYGDSLVTGSHQSLKVGGMDGIAAFDLSTPAVGTYTTPHFKRIDVNVQADGAGTKVQNSTFLFEVVPNGAVVTYNGTVFGNGTITSGSGGAPFGSASPWPYQTDGPGQSMDELFGQIPLMVQILVVFLLIFVPPLLVVANAPHLGMAGYFVGMALMVGIGLYVGIIPMWFLVLIGMALVVIVYGMLQRS